jgi:hypothetical protein
MSNSTITYLYHRWDNNQLDCMFASLELLASFMMVLQKLEFY